MTTSTPPDSTTAELPNSSRRTGLWRVAEPAALKKAELLFALLLTITWGGFHVVRFVKAGGLWRDEAAVVGLATLSPVQDVFKYFTHEAFPLLFPFTVRAVASVAGNNDAAFRVFGLVVGLATIAAVWLNVRLVRKSVPMFSLALLGFNGAFLQWGDSLRGYGLGALLIMLEIGLLWRLARGPSLWRFLLATLVALAAVQCLFHNPPLLLACCLGAVAVAWRRHSGRGALLVLLVGIAAAASLLPYLGPLRAGRDWDVVVRAPANGWALWTGLSETLSTSGWSITWVWAALFLATLVLCWRGQGSLPADDESRDALLFSGVALLVGLLGCLAFLEVLSYAPRPWYFLALIGMAAVLLDIAWDAAHPHWARPARLVLAALIAITSLPLTWREVNTRQTNIDLIADRLNQKVARDDLVVVCPWFMGITFDRYYTGAARWITVPPIDFHKFHRYDLVQSQMQSTRPSQVLEPVEEQIRTALKAGHRVWIVGLLSFQEEHPHDQPSELASTLRWSHELAMFLRASARHLELVQVPCASPLNHFENLPLRMVEGWAGP